MERKQFNQVSIRLVKDVPLITEEQLDTPEKASKVVARPMYILSLAAAPFVWLLSKSTSCMFNLLGIKDSDNKVTEEEIKSIVQEGKEGGEE